MVKSQLGLTFAKKNYRAFYSAYLFFQVKAYREYERNRSPLNQLTEEDQYMFYLTKIDRLATKLSIMSFLANFADNLQCITPQIHALITASRSVKNSSKLRRLLEVILAFGECSEIFNFGDLVRIYIFNFGDLVRIYIFNFGDLVRIYIFNFGDISTIFLWWLLEKQWHGCLQSSDARSWQVRRFIFNEFWLLFFLYGLNKKNYEQNVWLCR